MMGGYSRNHQPHVCDYTRKVASAFLNQSAQLPAPGKLILDYRILLCAKMCANAAA